MAGIDESLPFYPLGIAVLTISDTRSEETDTSGALLFERLTGSGHRLIDRAIVRDEIDAIQAVLKGWIANPEIEIILTTGGTGFPRATIRQKPSSRCCAAKWTGLPSRSSKRACKPSVSPQCNHAPLPGRRATASSSASRDLPVPVAMPGTACSNWNSTAATSPALSQVPCHGCARFVHNEGDYRLPSSHDSMVVPTNVAFSVNESIFFAAIYVRQRPVRLR